MLPFHRTHIQCLTSKLGSSELPRTLGPWTLFFDLCSTYSHTLILKIQNLKVKICPTSVMVLYLVLTTGKQK